MADQSALPQPYSLPSDTAVCEASADFHGRVEDACHVTATEPIVNILASASVSERSGQVEFIYENPGADSLQFDEPIRLYPCKLCDVKCKRPYDLDRHHQTKHSQSQHWFCPIDTCKLSRAVPGLSAALDASDLSYSDYRCRSYRSPLTHEVLHTNKGSTKLRLHGFSRRDKLTKHLKKAHQEEILLLGATHYGKGLSHTQSLVCEFQRFWRQCITDVPDPGQKWSPILLCRSQVDGKWSDFFGHDLKAVAEAGFRRWTKDDDESYRRLVQAPKFHDVLPWTAHDLILELGDVAPPPINHALQDYQMRLMLLEQQNKKRLMMARQEQDLLHEPSSSGLTALQDYQMRLMLLEQQNKKSLMMARQIQEENSQLSQGPSILDPAAGVQHQSSEREAAVSDGYSQPNLPSESSFAERSIPALSSGFEDSPWSTTNTQSQSVPDMGVEGTFAAFDWEAFLNSDLSSGIDIQALASDHVDVSAFDISGPESSFHFNNFALNNAAATEFDFDFNDPSSLPDWYFSAENGAEPDV